jgi:catechol 2,3-dioxygenase-like lactoylglutathione lyase family enzyme
MQVSGVATNLPVADINAARDFYTEYLGLSVEGFNMVQVGSGSRTAGPTRTGDALHPAGRSAEPGGGSLDPMRLMDQAGTRSFAFAWLV